MQKMNVLNSVLLNKFVLTVFVVMLLLALTSGAGLFSVSGPPPMPL